MAEGRSEPGSVWFADRSLSHYVASHFSTAGTSETSFHLVVKSALLENTIVLTDLNKKVCKTFRAGEFPNQGAYHCEPPAPFASQANMWHWWH